jgi:hypothetical protein
MLLQKRLNQIYSDPDITCREGGEFNMAKNDNLLLYKLIVLYMLSRVDFPLTKAQICDFILEKGYTDFLTLQQAVSELIDSDMVTAKPIRNRTHLSMTDDGRKTLQYFQGRISPAIRNEIDCYFKENKMSMRNEVSVLSDYSKTPDGDYEANLQALDKGSRLVGVTLTVPNEEIAASICEKWQKNNQKIYQYLIENLF